MRRLLIVILTILILVSLTSCARLSKEYRSELSYKDPETIGGYWNITTQTGQAFNHVKCSYWGTVDDTAVFVKDDGTLIVQSGAVTCTQAR